MTFLMIELITAHFDGIAENFWLTKQSLIINATTEADLRIICAAHDH